MSELKPCPFCGIKPELASLVTPVSYFYLCPNCGIGNELQGFDRDEARRFWNTRPIEDTLRAELARKDEQIEKLEDALHKISNWCKAYPLEIADEPTEDEWKTAHAIMNQHGWSLTTFVVSGMRRVTNGIAEIADLGG